MTEPRISHDTEDPRLSLAMPSLASVLGVVYALGFVIVNWHLARYGEASADLFRARYLAAGLLFLIVLGTPAAAAGLSYLIDREERLKHRGAEDTSGTTVTRWYRASRAILVVVSSQLVFYLFWHGLLIDTIVVEHHLVDEVALFAFATIWGAGGAWIIRDYVADYRTGRATTMNWLGSAFHQEGLHLTGVLTTLVLFGRLLYPNVAPQFGGGASPVVEVHLASTDVDSTAASINGRTVGLLDRSDALTYVLICDSATASRPRTVALRTDLIATLEFRADSMKATGQPNVLLALGHDACRRLRP